MYILRSATLKYELELRRLHNNGKSIMKVMAGKGVYLQHNNLPKMTRCFSLDMSWTYLPTIFFLGAMPLLQHHDTKTSQGES